MSKLGQMRRFHLNRIKDESGISGTGKVAEGVLFSSGWVALHWLTIHRCVTIYQSFAEMKEVHGHNGSTEFVWVDPQEDISSEEDQGTSPQDGGK